MGYDNRPVTDVGTLPLWINAPLPVLRVSVFQRHGAAVVDLGHVEAHVGSAAVAQSVADAFAEAARQLGELEAQAMTDQTPDGPSAWAASLEEAA